MKQRILARLLRSNRGGSAIQFAVLAGLTQSAMLAGCDRSEIHSYRVEREFEGSTLTTDPGEAMGQPQEAQVVWTVPEGWEQLETTSSMRLATFNASNGVEVAVTAFPGDVGGLLANVNRWRGQVGLDPTDEDGVLEHLTPIEGVNVIIVDIAGESARLVGSIIDVGDGKTWFAKSIGDSEAVEQIKDEITAFSMSFHIDEHAGHNHDHDHDHDHSEQTQDPTASGDAGTSGWTKPDSWTVESNSSTILAAAYNSASGARITLTALMGDGGGTLANINRWRGQLGLGPASSIDELELTDLGDGASMVDLIAPDNSGRMVAAIIPSQNQSLFFKMTGSVEAVGSEMERFEAFVHAQGLGKAVSP